MARFRFQHTTHDVIKQLYVKKKTFRWLIVTQVVTLLLLGLAGKKLDDYKYFDLLKKSIERMYEKTVKILK